MRISSFSFIRLTIHCSRLTVFRNEIATSSNQRTVGLLAMTVLDRYFYPQLILSKQHKDLFNYNLID
ncbi:MAG TPA: hypothetical protein GX009_00465 [Candidatus Atribacteria bacterium]|nr:hypothetical protein [Candidatus Atribacteria bacterium]